MCLLERDGEFLFWGWRAREGEQTMWCTPTSGLLSAAASVLAALEPTPRQPVMPTPYSIVSTQHSPVTIEDPYLVRG